MWQFFCDGYFYLRSQVFEYLEQRRVEKRFYSHATFAAHDRHLRALYKGTSPYRISKEYLQARGGAQIHTYGETPLTTLHHIVQECGITSQDRCLEMGAGRGRAALFLAEYVGCQVKAYEQIPTFVETFNREIHSGRLEMIQGDFFAADFSFATVIFLYGTLLSQKEIELLAASIPPKTKVISVSYSLAEYEKTFVVKKGFTGYFPWGETNIYWSEKDG